MSRPPPPRAPRVPATVWWLGVTSLCMDVASEMVHAVLPVFVARTLGGGAMAAGLIDGAGEALAHGVKPLSGAISDRFGRRKPLAVIGYALGAVSKPLFAIAPTAGVVLGARLVDRFGKGIRGAPRDALIADVTPPAQRGAAYGLRQALDTLGAMIGPLLAFALLARSGGDLRAVFRAAVWPGVLAVVVLLVFVREPRTASLTRGAAAARAPRPWPLTRAGLAALPPAAWSLALLGALLTAVRVGEAFVVLRASDGGVPVAQLPFVLALISGVSAAVAYPAGRRADRAAPERLLVAGLLVLAASLGVLALRGAGPGFWFGTALWGLHLGLTQGVLAALVANAVPDAVRATAFGIVQFASGAAALAVGLLAGAAWDARGAAPVLWIAASGAAITAAFAARLSSPRRVGR